MADPVAKMSSFQIFVSNNLKILVEYIQKFKFKCSEVKREDPDTANNNTTQHKLIKVVYFYKNHEWDQLLHNTTQTNKSSVLL